MDWNRSQRVCFHRILSGLKVASILDQDVRFLTLTSCDPSVFKFVKRNFSVLVKRIRRRYGSFEYLRVKTDESNGVLHVLFRGRFIPQRWLSDQWSDIHDSPVVDIRFIRRSPKSIGRYIVTQYLSGQDTHFLSYSFSQKWVFRGFVAEWNRLKRWFSGYKLYSIWNRVLFERCVPQSVLSDFG